MKPKKAEKTKQDAPIPFNEALKRVWASPPQHKKAKKKKQGKKRR